MQLCHGRLLSWRRRPSASTQCFLYLVVLLFGTFRFPHEQQKLGFINGGILTHGQGVEVTITLENESMAWSLISWERGRILRWAYHTEPNDPTVDTHMTGQTHAVINYKVTHCQ